MVTTGCTEFHFHFCMLANSLRMNRSHLIAGKITDSITLCFLVSVFCGQSGPLNTQVLIYTYTFFFPSARYYSLKYQEEKSPFLVITDKRL